MGNHYKRNNIFCIKKKELTSKMKKLATLIAGLLLTNLVYSQLIVLVNQNYSTIKENIIQRGTEITSGVNAKGKIYIEEIFSWGVTSTYLFNNDSICYTQMTLYPLDLIPDLLRSFKEYTQFDRFSWFNPNSNLILDCTLGLELDVLRILILPYDEKLLEEVKKE